MDGHVGCFHILLLFSHSVVCNSSQPHGLQYPGLPVPCHLPEFAQVHVHWITDAILPSHLLSPSSPAPKFSQHQEPFQWISSSHQVTKTLELHSASVLPVSIQDCFPLKLTGLTSSLSNGLLGVFSSTAVWRHQSLMLCFRYCPALTMGCDHWEDHSLDYTDLCWLRDLSALQCTV